MIDFFRQRFKITLFFCFNSLLPGSDIGTDLITGIILYNSGNIYWAAMTFFFMWNPFIFQFLLMTFKYFNYVWCSAVACGAETFYTRKELRRLFFLFPFATPIKNLIYAIRLYRLGFGMRCFESINAAEVEDIQQKAGSASVLESVLEAGPQTVVQLRIVLSTGRISYAQRVSIPISIFSLAWASSRAYFIERDEDNRDPDPEIKMVAMRIFPWMFLNVVHSIITWTSIAGLLSEYVIPSFLIYLLIAYCLQKMASKNSIYVLGIVFCATTLSMAIKVATLGTNVFEFWIYLSVIMFVSSAILMCGCSMKNLSLNERNVVITENFFTIKSVITSIWLPCIVGDKPYMFIKSAMISLVYKNVLFLCAGFLCYYDIVRTNFFLLWCTDMSNKEIYEARNMTICYSLSSCFDNTESSTTEQKIRICGPEGNNPSSFLVVILACSIVSLLASFKLHKISDHLNMYKTSRKYFLFDTDPVVHRALMFELASDDKNHETLEEVAHTSKQLINRQRRGESPLHYSTKKNAEKCTNILLKNGAELKEFSKNKGEPPIIPAVIEDAVRWNSFAILETLTEIRRDNPNQKHLSDQEVLTTISKKYESRNSEELGQNWTILQHSLFTFSPRLVRAMLNLVLPILLKEERNIPEVDFLVSHLEVLDQEKDRESENATGDTEEEGGEDKEVPNEGIEEDKRKESRVIRIRRGRRK